MYQHIYYYYITGTMSDEQPLLLKKLKKVVANEGECICICHYPHQIHDIEVRPLNDHTFGVIQNAVTVRQALTNPNHRLDEVCVFIPDHYDVNIHGYHQWCYSNFTNLYRFKDVVSETESRRGVDGASVRSSSRCSTSTESQGPLFPKDKCIFCDKGRKRKRGIEEGLTKCVTADAEANIKQNARDRHDFAMLGKIEGIDMRAKEAMYHNSCRAAYVLRERQQQPATVTTLPEDDSLRAKRLAYDDAFQFLTQYVDEHIIRGGIVTRMTMLRELYLGYMQEHHPTHYNPNHKTDKLKVRLVSRYGEQIQFWRSDHRSGLVYSSAIATGEAIEIAFEAAASESRILQEAALTLRRHIQDVFAKSAEMPWPPSASYLTDEASQPPDSLKQFLSFLVSGKPSDKLCSRKEVVVSSIAEDICYSVTNGRMKTPKHVLLAVTLHHLTGSAEIVTLVNRFGHCQSYSQVLELETAMANQVQKQDNILPSNITPSLNKVCHLVWDNFDINEETLSGAGTTHTTHGIIVQETNDNVPVGIPMETSITKSKEKSFKYKPTTLAPYFVKKHAEPSLQISETASQIQIIPTSVDQTSTETIWIMSRALCNKFFTVPNWSGWVSKTSKGKYHITKSEIGYLPPILYPITDYSTVQECLMISMEATKKLDQEFTFVTMDLAAAKIAYDIVWGNPDKFKTVVVNLGAFHTMCTYMGALGKYMTGSGFEEILIESGICASGSIDKVMSGKHFNRAIRVHQLMLDAIERVMLEAFMNSVGSSDSYDMETVMFALTEFAVSPSHMSLQSVIENSDCLKFVEDFNVFKAEIRKGKLGKTAQFWIAYCDFVWILLTFQKSVKENNLELYISSIRKMCNLLFSADHQNYARYLPIYYTQLLNLPESHPGSHLLLADNGFSVARSFIPSSRNALDITIEQTINRSAKTRGGLIGKSRNISAYFRWCLTRHRRATYVEATLQRINMLDSGNDYHKTTTPSEIKKNEIDVNKITVAFQQFTNPFQIGGTMKDVLLCISSGKPASLVVTEHLLRYDEMGNNAVEAFIKDRLQEKKVKFHEPMKKLKLHTFKAMSVKKSLTTTQKKTVQVRAERDLLGRLLMLSQEHSISLKKLFAYPLGPIPWAIATADGGMVKTNKALLMHHLEGLVPLSDNPDVDEGVHVIDGNALLQAMSHLPDTFEQFALQVFQCLPKARVIHFVTDCYKPNSIKSLERSRRGESVQFLLGGPKTKMPSDFKSFMHNSENKKQLIKVILSEWQTDKYAMQLKGREIFYVVEEECFCLQSFDGVHTTSDAVSTLFSNQEEADSRIVLHCMYECNRSSTHTPIIIRSPDTDVFVILLHYSDKFSCKIFFNTGSGNKRRLICVSDVATLLGQQITKALTGFHAFTGCDTVSAFVRQGKLKPFKTLQKFTKLIPVFQRLGATSDKLCDLDVKELQQFVCYMYGKTSHTDTNKVRYDIFTARYESKTEKNAFSIHNGIDLSLLPPCQSSLYMHCLRANYQSYIWNNSHKPYVEVPSPVGCGWRLDGGELSIDWTYGDIMPQQLLDVLRTPDDNDAAEEDELNYDYEVFENEVEEDCEVDNILDVIFDDDQDDD